MAESERDTRTRERESGPPDRETVNPLLHKLAETGVFECEWPLLRSELSAALRAALPQFMRLGPPVSTAGRVPVRSPVVRAAPEGEGRPWSESSSPESEDEAPSTPGGLVIPPFPPLDPSRRRKGVNSSPRLNGAGQPQLNPYEEDWDEEVIIGGRRLPGWMEEEAARRAVTNTAKSIDDLAYAPFTVQRLAELVIAPTRQHTTVGKFLRAVEKMLTVTTAYAPPSYVYVAPQPFSMDGPAPTSPSSVISEMDSDSTVPPASMTPMFSPIPFLAGEELGEPMLDADGNAPTEGLMSPLMLSAEGGGGGTNGAAFTTQTPAANNGGRSPTPEPEDEGESNPGTTPYLGRVDELDAGPLAHTNGADEGEIATGRGETGNMTPHGMHSRPQSLSSTTVIKDEEREIAPLPARSESGGDEEMADAETDEKEKDVDVKEAEDEKKADATKAEEKAEEAEQKAEEETKAKEETKAAEAESKEEKPTYAAAAAGAEAKAGAEKKKD